MSYKTIRFLIVMAIIVAFLAVSVSLASNFPLKRVVSPKPIYTELPTHLNTDQIVIKLKEGMGQPEYVNNKFDRQGSEWDKLNAIIATTDKSIALTAHFSSDKDVLNENRAIGSARAGFELPDLTLYHDFNLSPQLTNTQRLTKLNDLNSLSIVEIAYFAPVNELAAIKVTDPSIADEDKPAPASILVTPNWEDSQHYLKPAPTGVNAPYAWSFPFGKGENVRAIDIEGNWIQTHEDLHGGTDDFRLGGTTINEASWWNHGTAVLGEIGSDSNSFGMTGIAYNCDLGTVGVGSISAGQAVNIAVNNSNPGDVILIELHAAGPNANGNGQFGYVPMEYWQGNFDAMLNASALGWIVVEAGGNGTQNLDDPVYGSLFDPAFRFSGAIMVAASCSDHTAASFTNYGQRLDVHAYGCWDVFTLGYGGLYGDNPNNHYTGSFSGTSSASPMITGACVVLQGLSKNNFGILLDHNEMRTLLQTYSTPQVGTYKQIGPMPDLMGSSEEIIGVNFTSDTTYGYPPLTVNFSGNSGLSVDTWDWDFGDGNVASTQNASNVYTDPGQYTVELEISAGGTIRNRLITNYISVVTDTMKASVVEGEIGQQVEIIISANNTVPISKIYIPFRYAGDIPLGYDSMSLIGCRTDYFDVSELDHIDSYFTRMTALIGASSDTIFNPPLPPGDGPILKLYFTISGSALPGQITPIDITGYGSHQPEFLTGSFRYVLPSFSGSVEVTGCCVNIRGNVNGDLAQVIDIDDIVYLISYAFGFPPGPEPACPEEADANSDDITDIDDVIHIINYAFGFPPGPAPSDCY